MNIKREKLKFEIEDIFGDNNVYDLDVQIHGENVLEFNVLRINTEQFKALYNLIIKNNYTIGIEWAYDTRAVEIQIGDIK